MRTFLKVTKSSCFLLVSDKNKSISQQEWSFFYTMLFIFSIVVDSQNYILGALILHTYFLLTIRCLSYYCW